MQYPEIMRRMSNICLYSENKEELKDASCNTCKAPPLLAGDAGWLFPWIVSLLSSSNDSKMFWKKLEKAYYRQAAQAEGSAQPTSLREPFLSSSRIVKIVFLITISFSLSLFFFSEKI